MPYPPRTADLHHEMELVVAIGKMAKDIAEADGDGCGLWLWLWSWT